MKERELRGSIVAGRPGKEGERLGDEWIVVCSLRRRFGMLGGGVSGGKGCCDGVFGTSAGTFERTCGGSFEVCMLGMSSVRGCAIVRTCRDIWDLGRIRMGSNNVSDPALCVGNVRGCDSGNECGFSIAAVSRTGSPQSDCKKNCTTWSQSDTSEMPEAKRSGRQERGRSPVSGTSLSIARQNTN